MTTDPIAAAPLEYKGVEVMTADQALALAEYALPGCIIQVGATDGRIVPIRPLRLEQMQNLPGDWTWEDRHIRLRYGFLPSARARMFMHYANVIGHDVSQQEVEWLNGPATLAQSCAWLRELEDTNDD